MITKHKLQWIALRLGLALPLLLVLAGCNDNTRAPAETANQPAPAVPESSAVPNADNSAKNTRDRHDATLTSEDQSNTPADQDITQKIRKMLVSGPNDYSTTAKNIKIITINGKVTLRGPVKSDSEKSGIVAIAKNVVGDGSVDDQLEVKTNP